MANALRSVVGKLTVVDKLKVKKSPLHGAARLVFGGHPTRYPLWRTKPALKGFARQLEQAVRQHRPDAILSISSQALIFADVDVPFFLTSDAPWAAWSDTYAPWQGKLWYAKSMAAREASAARRARGVLFPSAWAAGEAVRRYAVPADRVGVVPWGANTLPPPGFDPDASLRHRSDAAELHLLFVGKVWERKGGPLTVEIAHAIARRGRRVVLHIVGYDAVVEDGPAKIVMHGFLDPQKTDDRVKLDALFGSSHFLVTPTHAECYGLSFVEAQAFGLPPVSRSVDAIPDVVDDGVTGIVLPDYAAAEAYVDRILAVIDSPDAYRNMASNCRKRFAETANWQTAASSIVEYIQSKL